MDTRYSSVYGATTLSKHHGGTGIVGCIDEQRSCSSKRFWADWTVTAAESKNMKKGDFI